MTEITHEKLVSLLIFTWVSDSGSHTSRALNGDQQNDVVLITKKHGQKDLLGKERGESLIRHCHTSGDSTLDDYVH